MQSIVIHLWVFPESDFPAWCELVDPPEIRSYREYLDVITGVQADQERQGREVVRAQFTVAEMKQELAARGLANTPDNRATITAFKG